jgi:hypothetical protein
MRHPIHAGRASCFGSLTDGFDEFPAHTFAARGLGGEQVLQIAHILRHPRIAMEDVVDQTDQRAVFLRRQAMHRLRNVEQPRPGFIRHRIAQRDLVEGLIA